MTIKEEQRIVDAYKGAIRSVCVYFSEGTHQDREKAATCCNMAVHFMRACFPKTYVGKEYDNNILNDCLRDYGIDRTEFVEFMLRNRW